MAVTLGPRLGLLINADIGEVYVDQFRPFLRAIDELVQASVINTTTTNPPSSPTNGDAYLILGTPTGAWTGNQFSIAVWSTEITQSGNNTKVPGWEFFIPNNGWSVWDNSTNRPMVLSSGVWTSLFDEIIAHENIQMSASTLATSGNNQGSPSIVWSGNYWNGTASAVDTWSASVVYDTSTNPGSVLTFRQNGSPGLSGIDFQSTVIVRQQLDAFGGIFVQNQLFCNTDAALSSYLGIGTGPQPNSNSPVMNFQGGYFNGTNFQPDDWALASIIGTGTAPTSTLTLTHSGSSGDAELHVPNINLDSAAISSTATAGSATLPANPLGFWNISINGTVVKVPYYSV